MGFKSHIALRLALVAAVGFCEPVLATTMTETYSFDLANFVSVPGSVPSPLTDISATFTLTFDPTVHVVDQTTGVTVDSLHTGSGGLFANLPLVLTVVPNALPGVTLLSIGGASPDGTSLIPGENDLEFFATINSLGAPSLVPCTVVPAGVCGPNNVNGYIGGYTLATDPTNFWHPETGTVTTVPEPATLSLLGLGLGFAGLMRKRKSI